MSFWSVITPYSQTNRLPNPSFEKGATGWNLSEGPSNVTTLSQSSLYQKVGVYSRKLAFNQGSTSPSYYWTDEIAISANGVYTFSLHVIVPGAIGNGSYGVRMWWYAAGSSYLSSSDGVAISTTGRWVRLSVTGTAPGTAVAVRVGLSFGSTGTDFDMYVDAAQLEDGNLLTSYLDGSLSGCRWYGAPHNSISSRSERSRSGGQILDLETFNFYVVASLGAGSPDLNLYVNEFATLPGGNISDYRVGVREMVLIGDLVASSRSELHQKRQALLAALKPDFGIPNYQNVIIRYSGGNSNLPIEIEGKLLSGFSGSELDGYTERMVLQFDCEDPYWKREGNSGKVLNTKSSTTLRYFAIRQRASSVWASPATNNPTTGGEVYAIAVDPFNPNRVYIGGNFTGWDGVTGANYLVMYDTILGTFSLVGSGSAINAAVNTLLFGPDGTLYIGGDFTTPGNYLAKYVGGSLSAVASGGTGGVKALAWYQGKLIIGGDFINWNTVPEADYIVTWNGSAYAAISTGCSAAVRALLAASDGYLYVGGDFQSAGGSTVNHFTRTLGSSFEVLTTALGAGGYTVRALVEDDTGGIIPIGTIALTTFVKWTGSGLVTINENSVTAGYAAVREGGSNRIFLGAVIPEIPAPDNFGMWNGSTFAVPDVDFPGSATVKALAEYDGELYVGFDQTGTSLAKGLTYVTPVGDAVAYPKIQISRSGGTAASLIYLENVDVGARLYLDYDLENGEILTFDFDPRSRSAVSSLRGDIWYALLRNSDYSSFVITPETQGINLLVLESGSPTVTAELSWRETFWSYDGGA